jgi:hypothetical protein
LRRSDRPRAEHHIRSLSTLFGTLVSRLLQYDAGKLSLHIVRAMQSHRLPKGYHGGSLLATTRRGSNQAIAFSQESERERFLQDSRGAPYSVDKSYHGNVAARLTTKSRAQYPVQNADLID